MNPILTIEKTLIDEGFLLNLIPTTIDNGDRFIVPSDCEEILREERIPFTKWMLPDVCLN